MSIHGQTEDSSISLHYVTRKVTNQEKSLKVVVRGSTSEDIFYLEINEEISFDGSLVSKFGISKIRMGCESSTNTSSHSYSKFAIFFVQYSKTTEWINYSLFEGETLVITKDGSSIRKKRFQTGNVKI